MDYKKSVEQLRKEKDDLNYKMSTIQDEMRKSSGEELERLRKQLKQEQVLKMQAMNKLAEIMNRKDLSTTSCKTKVSSADLRKCEECRKLQQELTQERDKYSQMSAKWQKELQELQGQAQEDQTTKLRIQMELDAKDSEIEQLKSKLASLTCETASLSSGGADNDDDMLGQESQHGHL